MKDQFRQTMAWLHTWTGLLLGWLLYFIFITGTAAYFDTEIDRWMKPELPRSQSNWSTESASVLALSQLESKAPAADRWYIGLPLNRNVPYLSVFWQGAQGEGVAPRGSLELDVATGEVLTARDTAGGQTLYQMHWRLHYLPSGFADWLVFVATMFMLVALITGVIVHKKIFADFFTFRPGKGQRSWLDAHNVVSVVSLPFQLMITYTGLILMMFTYMPLVIAAWYGAGDASRKTFFDEMSGPPALIEASGEYAALVDLDKVIADARRQWEDRPIASLDIRFPNDAHSRIVVRGTRDTGPLHASDMLVFEGTSGKLLASQPAYHSNTKATKDVMFGLHEALFAGPLLRAVFAFSGLLGAAMIATGLMLWTVKRRQRVEKARKLPHLGLRLVEKLNVATVIGLPVAIACYFWANRLLPLDMTNRAEWEVHSLFLVWLGTALHAAFRPANRIWQEQAWLASALFALLPLANTATTDRHLIASLLTSDWVFAGFDLSMLALGLVFACIAWRIAQKLRATEQATPDSTNAEPVDSASLHGIGVK